MGWESNLLQEERETLSSSRQSVDQLAATNEACPSAAGLHALRNAKRALVRLKEKMKRLVSERLLQVRFQKFSREVTNNCNAARATVVDGVV